MHWLVGLPTMVLFLVLLAVGFAVAAVLSWLSARAIEDEVRTRTSSSVTTVVGVIAALYAVLVAFVVVNEWSTLNDANAHLSDEAAALTAVYYNAGVLPAPTRLAIQGQTIAYVRAVVCSEIPYLADHDGPDPVAARQLQKLFATVGAAPPAVTSSAFYASAVNQLANVASARRARVSSAASGLPDVLLAVIIATSIVLVAIMSVLDTQHRRWHVILMGAVTLLVALNLALILTLARPFDGAASVNDAPLRAGIPSAQLACARSATK